MNKFNIVFRALLNLDYFAKDVKNPSVLNALKIWYIILFSNSAYVQKDKSYRIKGVFYKIIHK